MSNGFFNDFSFFNLKQEHKFILHGKEVTKEELISEFNKLYNEVDSLKSEMRKLRKENLDQEKQIKSANNTYNHLINSNAIQSENIKRLEYINQSLSEDNNDLRNDLDKCHQRI